MGRIISRHLVFALFPVQPRALRGALSGWVCGDVHQDLCCKAALQPVSPSLCWCLVFFLPRGRTWHCLFLTFTRFLSTNSPGQLGALWMAAQLYGLSATAPSFTVSADLVHMRVHLPYQQ